MTDCDSNHPPAFRDALRFWWKLGWISFGGPAGQIAIMHREIVERRRWLADDHFLHALNFCMLLPGPEAQQLATYLGWRLHGLKGGIAAGALFVLPSVFILMLLSWIYLAFGTVPALAGIIHGLEPAVIAIVAAAMIKIGRKSLRSSALWGVAALAFIGIFVLKISFVWIILGAGLIGWIGGQFAPKQFPASSAKHGPTASHPSDDTFTPLPPVPKATPARALRILACGLTLWWAPLLAVGASLGWAGTHFQIGLFFSKVAMITFGGAYSVLPYVAQQAVEAQGWLSNPQMLAGLGLAETTPGPLVIVLEFVGFVGGWQHAPAGWAPLASAILGSLITVWAIFVPCFMFIFLGGPYVEGLRDRPRLSKALMAITAAVVGVILNLAVVFTRAAIAPTSDTGWDWFCLIGAVIAFTALTKFHANMLWVLAGCAGAGFLYTLI